MAILDFITTGKYWLAAMAVTALLSFGGGWYEGEQSIVKPFATASVNAAGKARGEQATADVSIQTKDAAVNQKDSAARGDLTIRRDAAIAAIHKTAPVTLTACNPPISAEAMGRLNDPDLIGKDAQ